MVIKRLLFLYFDHFLKQRISDIHSESSEKIAQFLIYRPLNHADRIYISSIGDSMKRDDVSFSHIHSNQQCKTFDTLLMLHSHVCNSAWRSSQRLKIGFSLHDFANCQIRGVVHTANNDWFK